MACLRCRRLFALVTAGAGADASSGAAGGAAGTGDVVGPGSATDNAIARFDTTTGKLLQNSAVRIGDLGNIGLGIAPYSDGRVTYLSSYTGTASTDFNANIFKVGGDDADLNVEGAVNVKHGKQYAATYGYANTYQVYSLAGTQSLILGNNHYQGCCTIPYNPGSSEQAAGNIRFELGPRWPLSEVARFNNQGDFLFKLNVTADSSSATQSGATLTSADAIFSAGSVGKFWCWGTASGGTDSWCDRITGFTSTTVVTLETNRGTLSAQPGRMITPALWFDGQTGAAVFNQSVKVGSTEVISTAGYFTGPRVAVPSQTGRVAVGSYGAFSETGGGFATILGNGIVADSSVANQVVKIQGDPAHFLRSRYDVGFTFHTNITGAAGTTAADSANRRLQITPAGNVSVGNAALATNATDGFLYVSTSAGAPSGTPTTITGAAPIHVDTTNNDFYFYTNAWYKPLININNLTTEPSIASGDYVPIYDVSASAQRKITVSNLLAGTVSDIGSTVPSGTAKSVLFINSGPVLAQDATNFAWDDTNNRLGLGNNTPEQRLDVTGALRFGSNGYTYMSDLPSETDMVIGYNALQTSTNSDLKTGTVNASSLHPQAIVMGPGQGMRFITTSSWPGVSTDFGLDANEKMRLDPTGNLLLGTTSVGTSGAKVFAIANGTAPGTLANTAQLYTLSGELTVKDGAGNATTISPHRFSEIPGGASEPMAWSFYSERDGQRINVDMLRVVRLLEQLTGEKLVWITPKK